MIYLDYQATTPLAPEVFDAMVPWLRDQFANPHSTHRPGRAAAAAVEVAREQIVEAMDMPAGRLVFTSGATEAINIAIQGVARLNGGRRKVVTIATEHPAVRDTVLWLGTMGFEAVLLPVGRDGLVDLAAARTAIDGDTALVAAMLVNNEIGVVQPVDALAALAHDAGALFLCDAVQGFGRVDLPQSADLVALTAHKVHGPKGIGGLWLRDGLALPALFHGGGQEQGLRPAERKEDDRAHVEQLWARARELFAGWTLNGSESARYRGNLNLRRDGIDAARLMSDCRDVAFSLGSACASGSGRPSHVLQALGLSKKEAQSSLRLGFGRYTMINELERAAEAINQAARKQ